MKPMRTPVAGSLRKIVGFHLDDRFDWALNPPWTDHHWETTARGRSEHIGHAFVCSLCSAASNRNT